jgi:hypothetical protein
MGVRAANKRRLPNHRTERTRKKLAPISEAEWTLDLTGNKVADWYRVGDMEEEGDSIRAISSIGIEGIELGVDSLACLRRRHNCPVQKGNPEAGRDQVELTHLFPE